MDLTLRRCENTVLPRGSKVGDRRRGPHQDKLAGILQLFDRLLEDIRNAFYNGDAGATFHSRERIGSEQFGACGSSDARRELQSSSVERAPGQQNVGLYARSEKDCRALDSLVGGYGRLG